MLRLPIHGFAKRVEDTVARAMTFLRARDELAMKGSPPPLPPEPKGAGKNGRQH
jgi:hypothetical protein